ncbi:amino acid adenylation domain-containing protein [Streptomyces sp. SID5770]|uniref:non-ribosomal peptide synthetase n=1 Tax=Streptomyces sp. SID5770 TaxID=2690308 RepID=UPI00136C1E03|nr:non-ribosomal peptide synthetase [Streptomyces sp. SID5770]MZE56623.1 amino acid adenylation domain-containing protein [Streptomyces sp. SID5770]
MIREAVIGRETFEGLSAAKRELMASLLLARGRQRAASRTVRRRDPAGPCPLSRGQEQLWVAESLADGRPLYNVPYGVRLRGVLDVTALRAALDGLVARHSVLRTVYRQRPDGVLEQVVLPAGPVELPVEDAADEEAAVAAAQREAARTIDLASGPVLHGRLFRIAADDHLLALVVHHIATDAWSVGVLLEDLAELYDAAREGRSPRLPELSIDYADAAAHERAREPEDYGWLVAQWREQLAWAQPLGLSPNGDRGTARAGRRVRHQWDAAFAQELRRTAEAHRTTVFNVMLTAFAVLLNRYTGTSRFAIGTVMANRDRQTERLVGYFANTVPVVADLSAGGGTLGDVLAGISRESLWAREHQIPFDVLVDRVAPRRTLAESPLFEAMFVFNNGPGHEMRLRDLSLTPTHLHSGTAKFPLDLSCAVTDDEVMVSLEFDESVLDTAAAERLLGHYRRLLTCLIETPDVHADNADLLTPAEWELVVDEWNRTEEEYPAHATAHGLFEEWADLEPDAAAVTCGDEAVSYAELDARANRLAHLLLERGSGRHERVGVCLERGIDLVVAKLAVAKTGAGYVPLDPAYPVERLQWMLADSGARLVVTRDDLLAGDGVTAVDPAAAGTFPTTRPGRDVRPDDLLYLIYTSGSTGLPKGVLLDHRGRVNNFTDFNRRFLVGPGDKVFGVSALAFDMSAYDVFGTLMAGATVVFPTPEDERSPHRWIDTIERESVTVWHSVPALFGLLTEECEIRGGERLPIRLVLLGGDWIPLALPQRAAAQLAPSAQLVSMGGATEVSMDSTIHLIGEVLPEQRSIPYGVPMANQTSYVLDASLSPLPVGVPGELYLGGVGVGWGYHNRARLTGERFLPDPFGAVPGARMYRTGDRARWMPDGNLELLGRIDFQIKINGYRVETGEIEAALREELGGGSCLVAAHGPRDGAKTLVAYLVAPPGGEVPDDAELKRRLSVRLPSHMVPASFVRMDSFPLTHNGKVNRRELPAPTVTALTGRAAATDTERALVTLWREALGRDDVPVDIGFFTLGGNSIAVIRMVSAARRAGIEMTPRMVFAHQTVEALAKAVDEAAAAPAAPAVVRARPAGQVVTAGQRHMLDVLESAWVPGLYQMQSTTELPFPVDPDGFRDAWQALTDRHPALRTGFRRDGDGAWTPVVADRLAPEIEVLDWSDRTADAVDDELIALLEAERTTPFDVSEPPLWRVWLVRGPSGWWLGQIQSYLLADGWSNLVLLDELLALYLAALEGRPADLPPVPALDAEDGDPEADEAFWRGRLAEALPSRLAAEPGRLGPSRFARVSDRLDPAVADALRERATEHGHTFSTLACAGWALLAASRLERADVTVGVVSAGRDRAVEGLERAVGLFIAALPVRVGVDRNEPLTALFDRFQLARVEGAEHTSVPTGALQRMGAGEGPLFDSVVVVANYPVSSALRAQQSASVRRGAESDGTRNQTEYALRLDVTDDAEPRIALSYYGDRVADADARRLLDDYLALLATVARTPAATVGQVLPLAHPPIGDLR